MAFWSLAQGFVGAVGAGKAMVVGLPAFEPVEAKATAKEGAEMVTTIFDPDGDREIIAGSGPREMFVVSSKAMSAACQPWSAMLVPGTNSSTTPILLPDDDVDALKILLAAAHRIHGSVPAKLDFERLLQVAILCDRYDAVELVRPWVSEWISHVRSSTHFTEENAGWLYIAWSFGSVEMFKRVAVKMMVEMEVDGEGACTLWCARVAKEQVPSNVLECILKSRELMLGSILEIYYAQVDCFAENGRQCINKKSKRWDECDATQCGALLAGLQNLNLWPNRRPPSSITSSAHSLIIRLLNLKTWCLERDNSGGGFSPREHHSCSIRKRLAEPMSELLKDLPSPVTDEHVRHLERQCLKCPLVQTVSAEVRKANLKKSCEVGLECRRCGGYLQHCKGPGESITTNEEDCIDEEDYS